MRPILLVLAAAPLLTGAAAFAQGPLVQQPPGTGAGVAQPATPSPQGAQTPAGGVPTLSQQPSGAIPQDSAGPTRAPGSTADQGMQMPRSNDDAGTTTTYESAKPVEAAQWPCAQRKVSTISAGTIWSGPDVSAGKDWDQDNDLAALAQTLASRRTALDEVDPLIADFAKKAGADKDKQLTKLFVGVLELINDRRDDILQGIMRYAQGQQRLAERMRDESDTISAAQENATAAGLGVATSQQNRDFAWDQRIFKERKQALSYVCETPSLLERRAYEIGKRIQAQL